MKKYIDLDEAIEELELGNRSNQALRDHGIDSIQDIINKGVYGLEVIGIHHGLAKKAWEKVNEAAETSPEIYEVLKAIRNRQNTYNEILINNIGDISSKTVYVKKVLQDKMGIRTVADLIKISEDEVRSLDENPSVIKDIVGFVRKVKGYYENGTLEQIKIVFKIKSLDSSTAVLKLSNSARKVLNKSGFTTIGQIVEAGNVEGLIVQGFTEKSAEEIWMCIEFIAEYSQLIKSRLEEIENELVERREKYKNRLIQNLNISGELQTFLERVPEIETVQQLIELDEVKVHEKESNEIKAVRILSAIKKVRRYYESGRLDEISKKVPLKKETLESLVAVLDISKTARVALERTEIKTIGEIISCTNPYGLSKKGMSMALANEIWEKVAELAQTSPEIVVALAVQKDKIEKAKERYKTLSIDFLKPSKKHMMFFKSIGIKTIGELVELTQEQILEKAGQDINIEEVEKYLETVRKLYDNAALETIMKREKKDIKTIESLDQITLETTIEELTNSGILVWKNAQIALNALGKNRIFTFEDLFIKSLAFRGINRLVLQEILSRKEYLRKFNPKLIEQIEEKCTFTLNTSIGELYLDPISCSVLNKLCIGSLEEIINLGEEGLKSKEISPNIIKRIFKRIEEISLISPEIRKALELKKSEDSKAFSGESYSNLKGLNSSIDILNLSRSLKKLLRKARYIKIRQLVEAGTKEKLIIDTNIPEKTVEEIWKRLEGIVETSPQIKIELERRQLEIREKQESYQDVLVKDLEIFNTSWPIQKFLRRMPQIATVKQLIELEETEIHRIIKDDLIAKKILRTIRRIRLYYASGRLEEICTKKPLKEQRLDIAAEQTFSARYNRGKAQRERLNKMDSDFIQKVQDANNLFRKIALGKKERGEE